MATVSFEGVVRSSSSLRSRRYREPPPPSGVLRDMAGNISAGSRPTATRFNRTTGQVWYLNVPVHWVAPPAAARPECQLTVTPVGGVPTPPADVTNGRGADRLIGWTGSLETDEVTWAGRGFSGSQWGIQHSYNFGGGIQNVFKGSSALGDVWPNYGVQNIIENQLLGGVPAEWESYIGIKPRHSARTAQDNSPFDWFDMAQQALWLEQVTGYGAFCQYMSTLSPARNMAGITTDTEQGWWGLDTYGVPQAYDDVALLGVIESWGYETGKAFFQAFPAGKILVYDQHMPGGYSYDHVYHPDPNLYQSRVHGGNLPGTLWYGREAMGTKMMWNIGIMKAMADYGNTQSRWVCVDAWWYKPVQVTAAKLKYETLGAMAALSKKVWDSGGTMPDRTMFSDAQWNKICDRIDISMFSWAGTDSDLDGNIFTGTISGNQVTLGSGQTLGTDWFNGRWVVFNYGSPTTLDRIVRYQISNVTPTSFTISGGSGNGAVNFQRLVRLTSYETTSEPGFSQQQALLRRYGMGRRRTEFILRSSGAMTGYRGYDKWRSYTYTGPLAPGETVQNLYLMTDHNPPGGHLPGLQAAGSTAAVSTTPPTLSLSSKVHNGNNTWTLTGWAYHLDGIRCVRGYIHPTSSVRHAARLTKNNMGGSATTNMDAARMDWTLDLPATVPAGAYLMLTAVSIHDQEHSVAIQL